MWQRLVAVTPTTGDIEPTAHLNGFTATLTTSQNPAFTRPVQLLAVDDHHRLPVLDTGPAHPGPRSETPAPAAQSKSWAPRLPSVQRAHVGVPVQRDVTPDASAPVPATLPVIETGYEPEPARTMVQATDPDERRPLDAVAAEEAPVEPPVASPAATEPFSVAPTAVEHPTPAPPVPAVQRRATDTHRLPTVVQRVTAPSPPQPTASSAAVSGASEVPADRAQEVYTAHRPEVTTPPLRHLHTVQRTDAAAPTIPTLVPLPLASAPGKPAIGHELDAPKAQPVAAIQRIPDAEEPIADAVADDEQPAQAVTLSVVDERDGDAPVPHEAAIATTTPSVIAQPPSHAPAAVQRLTPQPTATTRHTPSAPSTPVPMPQQSTPSPAIRTDFHPTPSPDTTTPAAESTDLPVVTAQPVIDESAPVSNHYEPPVAQRSPTVPLTPVETHPEHEPRVHPFSVSAAPQQHPPTVMRTAGDTPRVASNPTAPVTGSARPQGTADHVPAAEATVAQRITSPVVDTSPAPDSVQPVRRPEASAPRAVQRSSGSARRLVVLPPVRSADDHGSSPSVAAHPSGGEAEVFSSPRPVGLQRMFEAGTQRIGSRVPAPVVGVESPPAAPTPDHRNSMDTAQSTAGAHEYDAATNTITFGSPELPSIQRATDEPAPTAETAAPVAAAPAVTSVPAASGSGAPAAAGTDVDELVNRVYDALAARLRAELWLDRERAGTLMDLGR
ncbi:hypothetical protein BST13_28975 [Mycobacterium aquaticum]|uniref:Uncharacterized protein n=1 Tax=Mycobacterium aquaticum TaxID=1927124 RepID=A0A1X0ADS5_9MYCO|nr:hypothetical protein BST13_28975 [Mycobacterium aquaticum]